MWGGGTIRGTIVIARYRHRRYGVMLEDGSYCAFELLDRIMLSPGEVVGGALDRTGMHMIFSEQSGLIRVLMRIVHASRVTVESWVQYERRL